MALVISEPVLKFLKLFIKYDTNSVHSGKKNDSVKSDIKTTITISTFNSYTIYISEQIHHIKALNKMQVLHALNYQHCYTISCTEVWSPKINVCTHDWYCNNHLQISLLHIALIIWNKWLELNKWIFIFLNECIDMKTYLYCLFWIWNCHKVARLSHLKDTRGCFIKSWVNHERVTHK